MLPNPQDVEGGGHGAFAGRQDRSHGQELGFAPGPGVKQVLKGQQQGYYDCGQGRHTRPLVVIWSSLPCPYNLSSFCTKSSALIASGKVVSGLNPGTGLENKRDPKGLTVEGYEYLRMLEHPLHFWIKHNWFPLAVAAATFLASAGGDPRRDLGAPEQLLTSPSPHLLISAVIRAMAVT